MRVGVMVLCLVRVLIWSALSFSIFGYTLNHGTAFPLRLLIDQALTLFGTPEKVYGRIWSLRDSTGTHLSHIFYYLTSSSEFSSLPLTVIISSSSLSLSKPQLRFTFKGTKGSFVKYGMDVQGDQLRMTPLMDFQDERFAVEP